MAWTSEQRDALAAKIAKGQQSISDGDTSVSYADIDKLQKLLDRMNRELATTSTVPSPVHLGRFRSGR
jgi:hypothetical protein